LKPTNQLFWLTYLGTVGYYEFWAQKNLENGKIESLNIFVDKLKLRLASMNETQLESEEILNLKSTLLLCFF
jgi:hypothetical protein